MRKGYYVKPSRRATCPAVWFAVELHTLARGTLAAPLLTQHVWGSATVAVSYRKRSGWTRPETCRVGTPDAMREWMHEHSLPRSTNWVIVDRVDSFLTLSEWFDHAETQGIVWRESGASSGRTRADHQGDCAETVDRFTAGASLACVRYTTRGRCWQIVQSSNYGIPGDSGTELPSGVGGRDFGVSHDGKAGCDGATERSEPGRIASITGLCDWWRANATAPWGVSVGQLAVGIMRSHVPPRTLLVHRDPAVHRLERAAAFGGRSQTWFFGNVGAGPGPAPIHVDRDGNETVRRESGPLVSLDVKSMYPSIMASRPLPTRLLKHIVAPSVDEMWDWCEHWGVIARVTIRTRRAEYPYRAAKGIAYPLGQFSTVLTGPELSTLRADGEVVQCHEMAAYHLTNVLSAGAQALCGDGPQAGCVRSAITSEFSKLLRNSLAGKMAQRNGQWRRELALDVPHKWGVEESIDAQTEQRSRARWVNGWAWVWDEDKDGAGPHTAVFAYITAHGRVMMRHWRDKLPPRTVVSQDTDGLWVLPSAELTALGLPLKDDCQPGELGNEGQVDSARFWGPKHYWTSRGWTLSGLHNPVAGRDLAEVWHTTVMPAWGHKTKRVPDSVYVQTQKCGLTISHPYQTVQPDGWSTPRMIHPPKESGPEIPD